MKRNKLILLTAAFPNFQGEFFLEDEITYLAQNFETVYIYCFHQNVTVLKRVIPDNVIVKDVFLELSVIEKIVVLKYILNEEVRKEIDVVKNVYHQKVNIQILKTMLMDWAKSEKVKQIMLEDFRPEDFKNIILYSYWHDYKALGIAKLKMQYPDIKAVSRVHGWDIDISRHQSSYLPFKKFITFNLDTTLSISEMGKEALYNLLKEKNENKVSVSRLGKTNFRIPILEKKERHFCVVSCSNLIPLKRVQLIIDILKELNVSPLKWVHFGDGYLRKEIEDYAYKNLPANSFEFKGVIPNQKILDFYAENYVDLFINLSESEGIPVSIMEAQSAGIPVLATDVGGTSEIVNSENGFLISKEFDLYEVQQIIKNYFESSSVFQKDKRKLNYNFWKENYDATKNYSNFISLLGEL